jgi:hypothetical protein
MVLWFFSVTSVCGMQMARCGLFLLNHKCLFDCTDDTKWQVKSAMVMDDLLALFATKTEISSFGTLWREGMWQ